GNGKETIVALEAATAMAVDAHHHRLFITSASGSIAVVNLRTYTVSYHAASGLPSSIASAAWAGSNEIAIVGAGGLALIDTWTWSVQQADATTTDIAPAPDALVAWNRTTPTGLTVYGPDHTARFHALAGEQVQSVGATA